MITEREAALSKLADLGRLLAGVLHDINTPVASILSNNEVTRRTLARLRQKLSSSEPTAVDALKLLENLDVLAAVDEVACKRILCLVRSLKHVARPDTDELVETDLHEVLRNAVQLVGAGRHQRIQIVTEFGDLPPIEGYPQKLSQVFLNLLTNAAESIEGQGTITIHTTREGECVCVSIADTGHGIPAKLRDKLFKESFTTKPPGQGTGLGLLITREIVVDKHRGSLDVVSEAGAGATFLVRLPIRQGAAKT